MEALVKVLRAAVVQRVAGNSVYRSDFEKIRAVFWVGNEVAKAPEYGPRSMLMLLR